MSIKDYGKIMPDVHWIKDGNVNCYLVEQGDELVLVDTGYNKKAKLILNYIRENLEDKKISKIFVTHHHLDHVGGLNALYEIFKPTIYASPTDAEVITGERKAPGPNNFLVKILFSLFNPLMAPKPTKQVEIIATGEEIGGFKAVDLSGHTLGSTGYLYNDIIFTGDAAVVNKENEVQTHYKMFTENLDMARTALTKLAEQQFDALLPGHGTPIIKNALHRAQVAAAKL